MKKRTLSLSVLAVLSILVLGACGAFPNLVNTIASAAPLDTAATPLPSNPVQPAGTTSDFHAAVAAYQGTLEDIYTSVSPSVVNIRVVQQMDASQGQVPVVPFFNTPQGQQPQDQYRSGLGSGFVWDKTGNIVTNNHVVEGADKIEVTFQDGAILPATLVGADPDSDLAVIKVDYSADKLQPIQVADSNAVRVGQLAVAIGDPFGLEGTMTAGIVSAMGRSLPVGTDIGASYTIPDIIQTDAAINPGNSGGVLVNGEGKLIGVTSAIESPVQANAGIGFAIPSAIVQNVVPVLIKDGQYEHAWLGISGTAVVPDLANLMKLPAQQKGVLVVDVIPNSPADNAGLQGSQDTQTLDGQPVRIGGDVITQINGQSLTGIDDLIAYLASSTTVGQDVKLTVLRGGSEKTIDVTLAARPSAEVRSQSQQQASQGITLGIMGMDMNAAIAAEMNLPENQAGVLVVEVQPGGLADQLGLRGSDQSVTIQGESLVIGGDVITAVNGQVVETTQELRAALAEVQTGTTLSLTIVRDGAQMDISLDSGG